MGCLESRRLRSPEPCRLIRCLKPTLSSRVTFTSRGTNPSAEILTVSPEYFGTMGIRLLAGRTFTPQDTPGHPTALVINQTMAQRFWPGESALGKRVVMKDWGPPLPGQIVGVVSDVKQDSLETDTQPAIYYSFAQFSPGTLTTYLIARSTPDPLSLAAAIRDQIWSVDRDQPVSVVPMDQIVSGSLERRRFVLTVLGTFAALALLLSVVGIYGVIAYSVGQQTHEFGIRMALGAQRYQLLLMVLRQTVRKLAVGLTIGIGGALILTRLMGSLLFGISATDPLTFSLAATLLLIAALVASFIPARRAATVNPMSALRRASILPAVAGILPSQWGGTPPRQPRDGGATKPNVSTHSAEPS